MTYRLAYEAVADLREIDDFVARQKNNPHGAEVVEKYLFEAFERIGANSARRAGKGRPEITRKPVKFLNVRKYVVIYDDRNDCRCTAEPSQAA